MAPGRRQRSRGRAARGAARLAVAREASSGRTGADVARVQGECLSPSWGSSRSSPGQEGSADGPRTADCAGRPGVAGHWPRASGLALAVRRGPRMLLKAGPSRGHSPQTSPRAGPPSRQSRPPSSGPPTPAKGPAGIGMASGPGLPPGFLVFCQQYVFVFQCFILLCLQRGEGRGKRGRGRQSDRSTLRLPPIHALAGA